MFNKNTKKNIIIATIKSWNIKNFDKLKKLYNSEYNFYLISNKDELNIKNIKNINPKYIFFPHWSWKIPQEIYSNFESIIFHETDLPYGRGGSPIQNLIINKYYDTKISAIRCEENLDSGDIYIQENINISEGTIDNIFFNISKIIFFEMIPTILQNNISPKKQVGEITTFKRRTPKQSDLLTFKKNDLNSLYDFIRMVDSDEYPKAYLDLGLFKVEFKNASLKNNKLVGNFEISENK